MGWEREREGERKRGGTGGERLRQRKTERQRVRDIRRIIKRQRDKEKQIIRDTESKRHTK